jgi:hypothetical protein
MRTSGRAYSRISFLPYSRKGCQSYVAQPLTCIASRTHRARIAPLALYVVLVVFVQSTQTLCDFCWTDNINKAWLFKSKANTC